MKKYGLKLSNNVAIAILLGSFVIAVAIIASAFLQKLPDNTDSSNPKEVYENITYVKTTNSPFLGNADAPITVIEYIDFECPFCKSVYENIMPQLKKEYIDTNKVKFVFKSSPLESIHITAFKKTEAAFCAYDQGGNTAFFMYHDELFRGNIPLNNFNLVEGLTEIASQNGLDTAKFRECLNTEKFKPFIKKDIVEATAIRSTGTPTWLIGKTQGDRLIDAVKLNGLHKFEIYKTVIDQLLEN